mmetsp:Transcript_32673/g.68123  ORF Transcript_32673/g.68123 Transcript_32673/m.68123 type:complete len:195 (+) Transcript_32673:1052-1636(+)
MGQETTKIDQFLPKGINGNQTHTRFHFSYINYVAAWKQGWYVEADKPVALFSGVKCTAAGTDSNACDILYEQIMPEETLARNYVGCPTLTRPLGCSGGDCAVDIFQLIATEDSTDVSFSSSQPGVGTFASLNEGDVLEYSSNVPHSISSTKPLYLSQVLVSQNSGAGTGDPVCTSKRIAEINGFPWVPSTRRFI